MLLFIIFGLLSVSSIQALTINEEIREAIESFKALMPSGSESLGFPPLAPYQNEFLEFSYDNTSIRSYFNLTDFTVEGLNNFDIKVLEFFKLTSKLTYDLTFNEILVMGKYYGNGNLTLPGLDLEAYGLGDVFLLLQELRLNGSFRLLPNLKGLRMTHFKIDVSLGNVVSKFTGILHNKYATLFFNRWLEEFLSMGINDKDNQQIVSDTIHDFVVPRVNGFLANYTLADLFKLVLGLGGGSNTNGERVFFNDD
ncbi:hypothetical protein ACFFRR_005215 [Megaselia abdita]